LCATGVFLKKLKKVLFVISFSLVQILALHELSRVLSGKQMAGKDCIDVDAE